MKIILKIRVKVLARKRNLQGQMQEREADTSHGHLLIVRIKQLLFRTLMVSVRFKKIFRHLKKQTNRKQFRSRLELLKNNIWLPRKVRHPNLIGINSHSVLQQIPLLIKKIKEKHGTRQINYQRLKNGKLRLWIPKFRKQSLRRFLK